MDVFLAAGGAGFILGGVVAFALATNGRRTLVSFGAGIVLALAWLIAIFASASTTGEGCHDCAEYFGRWLSPIVFLVVPLNAAGWIFGVGAGAIMRRARPRRFANPPSRSSSATPAKRRGLGRR